MSDSELRSAGVTLYNLSRELSEIGFAEAVEEKNGVSGSLFYIIPLNTRPYCAVMKKTSKIHEIGLGKYNLKIDLDGSVTYLFLEWEEGNSMRRELLSTINRFIDYLSSNKVRLQRFHELDEIEQEDNGPKSSDYSLLQIIDGYNLSEILTAGDFKGPRKRRLLEMIDTMEKNGTLTVKNGKYKALKSS